MTVSPASLPKTQLSEEALGLDRYSFLKRAVDLTMALFALVVLMPLMLLIALAIRLDSPGPVFYSQERVGLNRRRGSARTARGSQEPLLSRFGRPFKIYKFRSMVSDAEAGTGAVWATREDPRVTRLGRLLRRTHLDELPQFFNVVRGDMSIVGPRPERPEIVEHLAVLIPHYENRFAVLPGITGLAQVEYTYDHSLQTATRKLEFDLYYIRRRCTLLDLKLMLATLRVVARARGGGAHVPEYETRLMNRANGSVVPSAGIPVASAAVNVANGHLNGHANGNVHVNGNGHVHGNGLTNGNGHVHGEHRPIPDRSHRSQAS
jgi:lipopolysaccharide/colanic/teichoic acid biosynthesis glycosyltransferase